MRSYTDDYQQQAEAGESVAQFQLGLLYSTGQKGIPLDYVTAHKWLNLAAVRGNDDAKRLRSELADVMSREEISEAQRLAREWVSAH
ncbi:MAG: sel1 repeat family protein [Proteobacteria bacterium]|nr:sel1 repeat family protein [Pseudomonadota bacterium]